MFKDWCPLCGARFQGETPDEVLDKIAAHLERNKGEPSWCEQNFRPLDVALADDHY